MIMKFLKGLVGGAGESGGPEPVGEPQEHQGFLVQATPRKEASGWRVMGTVSKEIGGETRVHSFIRADVFPSKDDAVEVSLRKARQLVEQQGERMFEREG